MYFSPYTGTTCTVSSSNCPSFSCATGGSLLMLTAGPRGQFPRWRRSRKRLSVCSGLRCPHVITVQREFRARFRKDAPCTKLTLHCNHRCGHLKTEHTESLLLLRRHLGNWPRSKHEKRTAGSAWETWTIAAADGVRFARVRREINFLSTFETATFFCVYPVYTHTHAHTHTYEYLIRQKFSLICSYRSRQFYIKWLISHNT